MSLWRRIYVERRRIVLPLLILLIANVAVLALGVYPLKRVVAGQEQRATDALIKYRDAMVLSQSATKARLSKEQAELELKKFYAEILPTTQSAAANLAVFWVQDKSREANLRFKSNTAQIERDKDSTLGRVTAKVTLTGEYPNIRKFLYTVETAPEFIIIDDVKLSQPNLQVGNTSVLEVTLDVATYFLDRKGGGL